MKFQLKGGIRKPSKREWIVFFICLVLIVALRLIVALKLVDPAKISFAYERYKLGPVKRAIMSNASREFPNFEFAIIPDVARFDNGDFSLSSRESRTWELKTTDSLLVNGVPYPCHTRWYTFPDGRTMFSLVVLPLGQDFDCFFTYFYPRWALNDSKKLTEEARHKATMAKIMNVSPSK